MHKELPPRHSDRASFGHRNICDSIITKYKLVKYNIKAGKNVIIKHSVEFRLTDNAYLQIGDNVVILDYTLVQWTMPSPKLIIGKNVTIGRFNIITAKSHMVIGDNTLIGAYVQILDHDHGISKRYLIRNQWATIKSTTIGMDCWIGTGAKILRGVTIGDGCVIGANAVVTHDLPAYSVAVGVPAKIIKYRK
jgi:acetyltransferase-like isoleucine patch superfamily enzyme